MTQDDLPLLDFEPVQLIAIEPEESEEPPWPYSGQRFQIIVEVEHLGRGSDENPYYTILHTPDTVAGLFCDHQLTDLYLDPVEDLPIASGVYVLDVEFFYDQYTTMESWTTEVDYGLFLFSVHKFL